MHLLTPLALPGQAYPGGGDKKAYDRLIIKRSTADQIRNGTPVRCKVMLVWDSRAERDRQKGRTKGPAGIIRALGNYINTAAHRARGSQGQPAEPALQLLPLRRERDDSQYLIGRRNLTLQKVDVRPCQGMDICPARGHQQLGFFRAVSIDIDQFRHPPGAKELA